MANTRLHDYRNKHVGKTVIVCGCGTSLLTLPEPESYITIGVNDVGRLFDPTYLVVLNTKRQFKNNRFDYVENSHAKAIFTQLNLALHHPQVVRFELGQKGGTDFSSRDVLPYTRNSPYVAVCLAAYMGASRIGLIGVDFTEHHFFAKTGKHVLAGQINAINSEYGCLYKELQRQHVELVNLNPDSRLTTIPKQNIADFTNNNGTKPIPPVTDALKPAEPNSIRGNRMKLIIEKHSPGIVGDFLDALAVTSKDLGYEVARDARRSQSQKGAISVVWNGRHLRPTGPVLYCEHAWLPRWAYQISPNGINADSHIAPFVWNGKILSEQQQNKLDVHLESIRNNCPVNYKYMQTDSDPATGMPTQFIIVPLQMEWDTNIQRHVPKRYRHMQTLVNEISKANPSLPVIYKQHPADVRRGNRQLRLRLIRKQDRLWAHENGNIHQILKSGSCKGIISLNSNVVHDGLLWNVPSIVLGKNIWTRQGAGPFLRTFPQDWSTLYEFWNDPSNQACRDAYAYYLIKNQWTMEDIHDKNKVAALFNGVKKSLQSEKKLQVYPLPRKTLPVINVTAANLGWFFEDLKKHFLKVTGKKATIKISERPVRDADAWIYLRTKEAKTCPKPERCVVQIHDMFDEDLYKPNGDRHCVQHCAGIVLTHPTQRQILQSSGINLDNKLVLQEPIGALAAFSLKEKQSNSFTVAWVGRPAVHFGRDLKRADWFVDAVKHLNGSSTAILLGERLESQYAALKKAGIDCQYYTKRKYPIEKYPQIYRNFDCLVITSISEAGPLSLFEALAVGVPVVSTKVGWASRLIQDGVNGYLVDSIHDISDALNRIRDNAQEWFERRDNIKSTLGCYTLESWVQKNTNMALKLVTGHK